MAKSQFQRAPYNVLRQRLDEPRRFIQVLAGPRQVGKTTLVRQVMSALQFPAQYATADEPTLQPDSWLKAQWELARKKAIQSGKAVLILDEVQKLPDWSNAVKFMWDADTANGVDLHVVLLGSSPLLMQSGLSESLAGRFEVIPILHWSYPEMHEAFDFTIDEYIYFGGYPGAASLIDSEKRWADYIRDALVETTLSRDVFLMAKINKPALLRRLFQLGCRYSGQILSYQKMLGQLQDIGNTTTLAHYLELLDGAGLLTGLEKFAGQMVRQRGSSPKFQVYNSALLSVQLSSSFANCQKNSAQWGHLVESTIGSHIINQIRSSPIDVSYWREKNREVDFILSRGDEILAIEVKSGKLKDSLPGLQQFLVQYPHAKPLLVGDQGMPIKDFLESRPEDWF